MSACYFFILLLYYLFTPNQLPFEYTLGAITRGDNSQKEIALVFTGDQYADGAAEIIRVLGKHNIKASFFFTGNFYRIPTFSSAITRLVGEGHYVGAHSDRHLLYCDWDNRDSLLVTKQQFLTDLKDNYQEMKRFGVRKHDARYFLPPYEWYNDSIAAWTLEAGLQLINMTYGTLSHADYTTPEMSNYRNSEDIYDSILSYEQSADFGLNGFILLIHIGTAPERTHKFYEYLDPLITELKNREYSFKRVNGLLNKDE